MKVWISWLELWVQPRGRWVGTGLRSAARKTWIHFKANPKRSCGIICPHIVLFTLKKLTAAFSNSSPGQSQPHHSVSSLFRSAQPALHHPVKLRHWWRHSWRKYNCVVRDWHVTDYYSTKKILVILNNKMQLFFWNTKTLPRSVKL